MLNTTQTEAELAIVKSELSVAIGVVALEILEQKDITRLGGAVEETSKQPVQRQTD